MLTIDKVYDASKVLKEIALQTEIIPANINPGCDVYLKTENLQVTGSFKVRGAYYKIHNLTEEERSHGVIACSAGNHAQGVAPVRRPYFQGRGYPQVWGKCRAGGRRIR